MKKRVITTIVVILVLYLGLNVGKTLYNSVGSNNSNVAHGTETPKIDTMYPDDIVDSASGVITVERAEADLRANKNHESLDVGVVKFDNVTYEYPNYESFDAIFWFDISVQYELGNENYRAKVKYNVNDSSGIFLKNKEIDIWQVESTFTEMGKWTYDDGETHILVNFIRTDESGYVVEYEIEYYASYWTGSHLVESVSDGEVTVYGNNEWDGDNYYLSIDLGDFYNESEQTMDRGYVKIYPWGGVYWDALHANGGPFRLTKG